MLAKFNQFMQIESFKQRALVYLKKDGVHDLKHRKMAESR